MIGPFVIGILADETSWREGYGWVSVFFACASAVGILVSLAILSIDYKTGKKLDVPYSEKASKF